MYMEYQDLNGITVKVGRLYSLFSSVTISLLPAIKTIRGRGYLSPLLEILLPKIKVLCGS